MTLITYVHLARADASERTLCGLVRTGLATGVVSLVNVGKMTGSARFCAQCLHRFHRIRV